MMNLDSPTKVKTELRSSDLLDAGHYDWNAVSAQR
jgi:hypothetical protein